MLRLPPLTVDQERRRQQQEAIDQLAKDINNKFHRLAEKVMKRSKQDIVDNVHIRTILTHVRDMYFLFRRKQHEPAQQSFYSYLCEFDLVAGMDIPMIKILADDKIVASNVYFTKLLFQKRLYDFLGIQKSDIGKIVFDKIAWCSERHRWIPTILFHTTSTSYLRYELTGFVISDDHHNYYPDVIRYDSYMMRVLLDDEQFEAYLRACVATRVIFYQQMVENFNSDENDQDTLLAELEKLFINMSL